MNFLKIFTDILRFLLWIILRVLFTITDALYDVIKGIACYNLLGDSKIWNYFSIFITAFLSFFIIFRLCKRYLKSVVDEEEAQHLDPLNIILKIASIGLLIVLLPFLLKAFGTLLSQLVTNIETIFGVTTNKFSHILLGSIGDVPETMWDKLIDLDITETAVINGTEQYKYLNDWSEFLCLVIGGVFCSYILLLIGLQIGGRLLSMVMKLIIAPYSISSIVDEKNDSFQTWWKLFIADFLATYMQMLLLIIGSTLFLGIDFNVGGEGTFLAGLAKIVAYIGALMGVLNAPSGVSQLIGADIGVSSALQSMQTTMMGLGIASSAGRLIGGAAKTAGAGAIYSAGRLVGGSSIKSQMQNATGGGFVGNISGGLAGWGDGSIGLNGGEIHLNEDPVKMGSKLSDRSGISGMKDIASAISNGNGVGDVFNAVKQSGLPNVASSIANYNYNNGSIKDMLNNKNIGGLAVRGISNGASKMYSWSCNTLSKGKANPSHNNSNNFMNMANQPIINNANLNNNISPNGTQYF